MTYAEDDPGYGDEVLYRMCSERPLHDDMDTIVSKIVLIGRITGASLERGVRPDLKMNDVAQTISRSALDKHIEHLNALDRPTDDNLPVLLEAHQYLTDLLESITGVRKRALASKYLHFHAPKAVFIFDAKADLMLRRQMPKRNHPILLSRSRFGTRLGCMGHTTKNRHATFGLRAWRSACLLYRSLIFQGSA